MPLILPRRSLLAYPAGRVPGVDQSHPASDQLVFSSVALGANHIDLTSGAKGVISGTVTGPISIAGPGTRTSTTTGDITFTNIYPSGGTLSNLTTMAAILTIDTFDTGFATGFSQDNLNTTGGAMTQGTVGTGGLIYVENGVNAQTTVPASTIALGVPWFVAYGIENGGAANSSVWVATNLVTGQILSGTFTATAQNVSASGGGVAIGNSNSGAANGFGGVLHATMFSNRKKSIGELLAWAKDPWSFWYPNKVLYLTDGGTPIVPAVTTLYQLMNVG